MALYSTGRMEFFERARAIYASYGGTGHLLLKPYFGASIKMFVYDLVLAPYFFVEDTIRPGGSPSRTAH
ncbi:MAG: hypothetical protein HGJ94_01685 [Desulfosarcina sp.]|nr:hypothetical protein [Desulfosarcina sp.]